MSNVTEWKYIFGTSDYIPDVQDKGYIRYRVNRFNVELDIDYLIENASETKFSNVIPEKLRPSNAYWFAICATKRWNMSNNMAYCEVKEDGTVWVGRQGAETDGRAVGIVSWPVP